MEDIINANHLERNPTGWKETLVWSKWVEVDIEDNDEVRAIEWEWEIDKRGKERNIDIS